MTPEEFINSWREEITGYLKEIISFQDNGEVGEVLRKLSSYSARASYCRQIATAKTKDPKVSTFVTSELEPFMKEVQNQFSIWSRIHSREQFEWDMSKG